MPFNFSPLNNFFFKKISEEKVIHSLSLPKNSESNDYLKYQKVEMCKKFEFNTANDILKKMENLINEKDDPEDALYNFCKIFISELREFLKHGINHQSYVDNENSHHYFFEMMFSQIPDSHKSFRSAFLSYLNEIHKEIKNLPNQSCKTITDFSLFFRNLKILKSEITNQEFFKVSNIDKLIDIKKIIEDSYREHNDIKITHSETNPKINERLAYLKEKALRGVFSDDGRDPRAPFNPNDLPEGERGKNNVSKSLKDLNTNTLSNENSKSN